MNTSLTRGAIRLPKQQQQPRISTQFQIRATRYIQRQRRQASTEASSGHAQSKKEPLGRGFYLLLFSIPSAYIIHSLSSDSSFAQDNFITRLIEKYTERQEDLERKTALHVALVEQAGRDKNLFDNTPMPTFVDLRFPEALNSGSSFNVHAGHSADLSKVIKHLHDKHLKEEERKRKNVENDTLSIEGRISKEKSWVERFFDG